MPNKEDENVMMTWCGPTTREIQAVCRKGKDENTQRYIHEEILEERCINTM